MLDPSKIMIAQVYLHIEHNPLMHKVATLDSPLKFSLFFEAHWPIASFLVVD